MEPRVRRSRRHSPGRRRVPADVEALTEGRAKVILVKIHEVGEPAPEDAWLQAHARLLDESRQQAARISVFRPLSGERFVWGPSRGSAPGADGRGGGGGQGGGG